MIKNSRKSVLLAAAAVPAISALFVGSSFGALTATVTNLGVATDSFNGAAAGYTAYELVLTADTGDTVDNVTAGGSALTSSFGIFGPLIQDFVPGSRGGAATSTPLFTTMNNAAYGIDSHFTVSPTLTINAPTEDSNNTQPAGFPVANDSFDMYGQGTTLTGSYAFATASTVNLAYIVLKNGTTATYNIQAAEGPTGQVATLNPTLTGTIGAAVTTTTPIISLTAAAPAGTASGTITITGSNGSYKPGSVAVGTATGLTAGFVTVSTFTPAADEEVFALKLDQNGTPIATTNTTLLNQIVADINANGKSTGGVSASLVTGAYVGLFPSYDILLTAVTGVGATPSLAFDFSQDATTTGVTVTNVAAVPEPTTLAVSVMGAAGLLLGRRKSRTAAL